MLCDSGDILSPNGCRTERLQNHNNSHKEKCPQFHFFQRENVIFIFLFFIFFFHVLIFLLTAANCILIKFHHNFGCWYLIIEFTVSQRIFFFLFTFMQPKPHIKMAFLMLSLPAKATAEAETNTSLDWYSPTLPLKTTNYSRNLDSHIKAHGQYMQWREGQENPEWNGVNGLLIHLLQSSSTSLISKKNRFLNAGKTNYALKITQWNKVCLMFLNFSGVHASGQLFHFDFWNWTM